MTSKKNKADADTLVLDGHKLTWEEFGLVIDSLIEIDRLGVASGDYTDVLKACKKHSRADALYSIEHFRGDPSVQRHLMLSLEKIDPEAV